MASKSSSKQRSQGGGRRPNSEPRLQVFKEFNGCNFAQSPHSFTLGQEPNPDREQADLTMNYVVLQNNIGLADNKTMETRSNIRHLFSAPAGHQFTDASVLVGPELYIACENGDLPYYHLNKGPDLAGYVELEDKAQDPEKVEHHWESLAYADDQLIGTTLQDQLWTGPIGTHSISNARKVPDPDEPTMENLVPRGELKVEATMSDECCFRVAIAYSYINKFGPTKVSRQFSFYCNYPVDEWHSGQFLQVKGIVPVGYDVLAVEIYYNTGNASSLVFAGRTDSIDASGNWYFDWFGYLDVTSMWPAANLIAPTENLTEGVKASRITCVDSRLYFWGSELDPQRLWIGGNPGNLFSTSAGTGGGFVDVEPGTGQEIRVVCKYKTQSGNSIVTMLCDSDNSTQEQRFNLVENTVTISNEQNMKSWQAEQVAGAVGCKSFHGAKVCQDGLYSVSRYGLALTTMTMEYNSQIRTTYVSAPVKPVFTDKFGNLLSESVLLECDGVLYLCLASPKQQYDGELDKILFCYDIDLKAWWTYTLDVDEPIIDMIHIDWEGAQEGIGIVTPNNVYLLPTTLEDDPDDDAKFDFLIQTGELATTQPQQNWIYLSQMEFRFDRFKGDMRIELVGYDQFGRKVETVKNVSHNTTQYNLTEFMRVDLRLQSYRLRITGKANFRMTHFIAKVYTMSSKVGLVWGFDDSQSFRSFGDIHPTFKDYNDIRKAIHP